MESSTGEVSGELAAAIVEAAATLDKAGHPIVQLALVHPDAHVRKKAAALATWSSGGLPAQSVRAPATTVSDVSRPATNPRVEVVTNRGTMTFDLFPAEAPNHVRNFLELVSRHHYDGLTFHRVELDFVVQGGDHRGDGNGGITWNDAPLRAEFTPRKFVRGSLGMPRNDDPDSGGSQFFVTHRDTPHLDGRYTNFGMLVAGFDTLDAIEVGDTIQTVRVVPAQ
jgi:cyclophilin family peptidyl-prolyl cis-trans isomerase